ncbi:uroporphyrinogen decarboxylase [Candidatus Cyanaurora vandensis]|uniref:uroporphyrinogen decarboxylase n=1 Tax=Candidatus Cyanaurora vandensis TaxID=2714958 RepID=UPI002580845D|nr:uroporphyrinogen decarboxylase [Candidatus Cyanaurora vandensis]
MNDRILRAARHQPVDRPPVWMMRQAGRYMKSYRALRERYSFRERSEIPELAVEISLQPFHEFGPDGVIMFSDILTPLPGLGINFDIVESRGPLMEDPIRTQAQVDQLTLLDPEQAVPFVGTILKTLRQEVGDRATVLGFVGAPWTLAAYAVEGKTSKDYALVKTMAFTQPKLMHSFLEKLAQAISGYMIYQIDQGAQAVQMFDSWAGQLPPWAFREFALPYQQQIFQTVKAARPEVPLILYISGSSGVLELMGQSGADVISVDWTLDLDQARARLGPALAVQGNLDPCVLFAPQPFIATKIREVIQAAGPTGHIMNLGHGILPTTPEENARFFFEFVKSL